MNQRPMLLLACTLLAGPSLATDRVVDASGLESPFTTIDQAMVQSSPGDRILVLPGSYPSFHFSRGVEVIGLGLERGEVVVDRVDFHVNIPIVDYDAVLANLTVCGVGAANSIAISGNELAAGTLVVHDVDACGGVFLNGDPGFYLLVNDSHFTPGAGGGFVGAAFDFLGGVADFVDSSVTAWDAPASSQVAAGVALRLRAPSTVRASDTHFSGGAGNGSRPGAPAIASSGAGPVTLRLSGSSTAVGGESVAGSAAGAGVSVAGTIRIGDALVLGGAGPAPGPAYDIDPPILLGYDPQLKASPSRPQGTAGLTSNGIQVHVSVDASISSSATIAYADSLAPVAGSPATALPSAETSVHAGNVLKVDEHVVWSGAPRAIGGWRLHHGFFMDPDSKQLVTTNPVLLPMLR